MLAQLEPDQRDANLHLSGRRADHASSFQTSPASVASIAPALSRRNGIDPVRRALRLKQHLRALQISSPGGKVGPSGRPTLLCHRIMEI
jgi:hypothetical protein